MHALPFRWKINTNKWHPCSQCRPLLLSMQRVKRRGYAHNALHLLHIHNSYRVGMGFVLDTINDSGVKEAT